MAVGVSVGDTDVTGLGVLVVGVPAVPVGVAVATGDEVGVGVCEGTLVGVDVGVLVTVGDGVAVGAVTIRNVPDCVTPPLTATSRRYVPVGNADPSAV